MQPPASKISSLYVGAEKGANKSAIEKAELIADYGIKGDSHAGLKPLRHISLFEMEVLRAVQAESMAVTAEELSANLFTENIRLETLRPGSRLRINDVIIEITETRKPCGLLTKIDKRLPKRLYRNVGVFGKIIQGGVIHAGDVIELLTDEHLQTTP
jgi:MOSC domain-containing protein YiiM